MPIRTRLPASTAANAFDKRTYRAHRLMWEEVNGPIPEGMVLLHICDNPPCIRLDHLRLGTQAENVADMVAKGRHKPPPSRKTH